jgi:hypothetical protein
MEFHSFDRPYGYATGQQAAILEDRRRFVAVPAGRRWGKSTLAALKLWGAAIDRPGVYICISPSLPMARLFWERCSELLDNCQMRRHNFSFHFGNGSKIYCLTQEDILNGATKGCSVKGIAVDEFFLQEKSKLKDVFWPMLMAENDFVLMAGTPPPRRAVKRLRLVLRIAAKRAGLNLSDVGIHVCSSPMERDFIEECRVSMPKAVFDSEFPLQYANLPYRQIYR